VSLEGPSIRIIAEPLAAQAPREPAETEPAEPEPRPQVREPVASARP